ncbi:L,D-transpeptidase family protein [Marinobacter sp.]|uniref:L,D-transpeptidase family protein n=1 Tax=Marinobacter sp. TaxID=50741 RepID=UPI00198B72D2|nr:L,D-transpeptidase family protein [Marinobacter sp.]MBD3657034.1 L,D-transpeptidase family protein [Marinobacter sp.]
MTDPRGMLYGRQWSVGLVVTLLVWACAANAEEDALADPLAGDTVELVDPPHEGYQRLLNARVQVKVLQGLEWPVIPPGPSIHSGESDERLPQIRQRLTLLGDFTASGMEDPSLYYDLELESAVRNFQARHGLEVDGVIGRRTLEAMNVTPQQRLNTIDVNLERWRWLPDVLGETRVQVNIAGYELQVFRDGRLAGTHRVVVGRPYRSTPLFSDQIRYLEFNPTWTVPFKLMVEDELPKIRRDPDRLRRLGFAIYQGWGDERRLVDPDTIDWDSLSRSYFPYQLVQQPGPTNALGQVKFMFPNRFAVYLHDTPAKNLFWRTERIFSSGCIRVDRPFELALQLLGDEGWDRGRINSILDRGETRVVHLPEPVPIHLQYWTAWAEADGTLNFRRDIYDRDHKVLDALRASAPGVPVERPADLQVF